MKGVLYLIQLLIFMQHSFKISAQTELVYIDCGATSESTDNNGIKWSADGDYTFGGEVARVSDEFTGLFSEVDSTIRRFTKGRKNCYGVPVTKGNKYMIQVTYFYGNYDGLNHPPQFRFIVDSTEIETIVTNTTSPSASQVILVAQHSNISVCLGQISRDQIPFLSSLHVRSLDSEFYKDAPSNVMLYGGHIDLAKDAPAPYPLARHSDEKYGRLYNTAAFGYPVITTTSMVDTSTILESPPSSVMQTAITYISDDKPLGVIFTYLPQNKTLFFVLYFAELQNLIPTNDTREFAISVNGKLAQNSVIPQYLVSSEFRSYGEYPVGTFNFTMKRSPGSTLGPILNAFDIYIITDMDNGTSILDVQALEEVKKHFGIAKWLGDPCLPEDFKWEEVKCNTQTPPQVIDLDLSNMNLIGSIPTSLANLTSLESLNLANNNLAGEIPKELQDLVSKGLKMDVSGNKYLCTSVDGCVIDLNHGEKGDSSNKKTMIIATSVSVVVGLSIIAGIVTIYTYCKPRKDSQVSTTIDNLVETDYDLASQTQFNYGSRPLNRAFEAREYVSQQPYRASLDNDLAIPTTIVNGRYQTHSPIRDGGNEATVKEDNSILATTKL